MQPNRIRFVTGNYAQLQGLRLVPIGIFLMICAVSSMLGFLDPTRFPPPERARMLTRMGFAFWLALGLALAAPLYYRFRYGSVEGFGRRSRDRWITAAVIGFFVMRRLDGNLDWPVSLSLLLIAASLLVTALAERFVRPYYPAAAALWLVAGCLPALGGPSADTRLVLFALGGLTLIIVGVGDHLLLTRTLASPPHADASHPTSF